ncbi:MAG: hypothetical protein HZB50_18810 [Chloroflexi bacterium]|nr:hypothetical protein [Chloroflexota bacterium]
MFHRSLNYIWRVIALSVLILGASCAPSSSGAVVKIESPASPVQVNETVTVPVKIENIAGLIAMEIHLSFDPNLLEVVSLTDGGFVVADFTVQNTFDNTAGTIDYAVAQMNRPAAEGSGTLFEIVFRAKTSGNSAISFHGTEAAPEGIILSDANGKPLQVTLTNGTLTIK